MTHDKKKRYSKPDDFSPVKDYPKDHKWYGSLRCQAWNPNQGRQCLGLAMVSRNKVVCRKHGGLSKSGIEHSGFKDGSHSKYLPVRLAARYQEAREDPELLNMRDDISLVEARVADLLSRVDSAEAGVWWKKARSAYDDLMVQMRKGNNDAVAACLNDLSRFINIGSADYAVWDEVMRLVDQRRRLVESERKRLVEMQQMITSQEAWILISSLLKSVNENVTDPDVRARVQSEFIRLTEIPDRNVVKPGSGNGNRS